MFQRLKGWVIAHKQALCLVALREEHILYYENRHAFAEFRDHQKNMQWLAHLDDIWQTFVKCTDEVLEPLFPKRCSGRHRPSLARKAAGFSDGTADCAASACLWI